MTIAEESMPGYQRRETSDAKQNLIMQKSTGVHDSAHRKRLATANKRCFDADSVAINCEGRDGLLYVLGRDNTRLNKWRIERGALIFPDWSKGEIILGGKDDVRKELRNEILELIEEKDVSEFYVPQVVNMSFLVGHNCRNLKKIEEKTGTFLRPKGSHKTVMIAGQDRPSREFAKKMLKELCGNLFPTASSHLQINGNVPRTATVVFMDKDFGYIPPLATGRHAKVLGIEEGQAFLEDTEDNKLCLLEPYAESDGALQQARPLGSLLQTNTEFIQQSLFHFLNEVRPHKGMISLKGSYGKILFLDLSEDVSSVCWSIEEFAYQSMLFNLRTIFSPRCDLMEENISDKLGGNLEECNMKYEFAMIDKTPKDKNKCRNVVVHVKHTVEDEAAGDHRFEIVHIVSSEKKHKEFTKSGDLNPNRTERFCANVACVDRKVDLQIRVECAHVIPHENFSTFVERLQVMPDESVPGNPAVAFECEQNQTIISVNKIAETVIGIGSIKIVISSVTRGSITRDSISRDTSLVKFESTPYTKIEVCSKVWEGAFNQNVLAAYDEAGTSKMTWSAEQILMKDLEDFMNVAQNASKYVKPE
ncbi:uncharacterized protein LOC134823784 isoform X2 [Bolinopsis microptera]|uniref:uncharacterized protein LOC134823784 isoform X2 n=1 Tax=Bolinopsis microptera TaxID=2820187 RepID=UPI00307A8A19